MSYSGKFKDKNNNLHPVTSVLYGTCDTAAATVAKVVTCTDFDTLMTGVTIRVKFANANTAASPTVNINSTGAKSVYRFGSTAPVDGNSWNAGEVVELVYDGTSFFMTGADDIAAKQNATDNSLDTDDKTIVGAINENAGDISSLKSGLTNLDNEVNGDATVYPYADVITIEDAVPSNLADCNVKIEPVQDLHGQSAPYVGGAGKNKLPTVLADIKTANTDGTWSGNAYTVNGVTFTVQTDNDGNVTGIIVNGTASGIAYFDLVSVFNSSEYAGMIYNGSPSNNATVRVSRGDRVAKQDLYNGDTIWNSGDGLKIAIRVTSAITINNEIFKPMIRLATETDATFAPYTNYCPITGHTEASVQRDGKNRFDKNSTGIVVGKYLNSETGELVNSTNNWNTSDYIYVGGLGGESITFSGLNSIGASNFSVCYYDKNNSFISGLNGKVMTLTIPSDERIAYLRFDYRQVDADDIQLEKGQTATPYVPYAGKTYTLALGDTIYGGTVDFDSGVMTVTHKYVDLGDYTWSYNGNNQFYTSGINDFAKYPIVGANEFAKYCICEKYKVAKSVQSDAYLALYYNTSYSGYRCFVLNDPNTEAMEYGSEFKTYITGTHICYELATPFTVQLTPQQIQLLKGQNTLTASTGQISVTVNGVSGAIGQVQTQANATDAALAELAADIADKLPTAPTTDGAYVLTVTVADGTPTYSWESAT